MISVVKRSSGVVPFVPLVAAASLVFAGSAQAADPPPLGSVITKIVQNQIDTIQSVVPIIVGSTEQCTACLGPASIPSVPSTGWGVVGVANGILLAPKLFIESIGSTGLLQATALAVQSVTAPITNTEFLLNGDRSAGGAALLPALERATFAIQIAVSSGLAVASELFVLGPARLVQALVYGINGGVPGIGFINTLATGGTLSQAVSAFRAPIESTIAENQQKLTTAVNNLRENVGTVVSLGPQGVAASPIPVMPPAVTAAVSARKATVRSAVAARKPVVVEKPVKAGAGAARAREAAAEEAPARAHQSRGSVTRGVGNTQKRVSGVRR